jgi:16S rRNA (adenine1518-N6/adenine1519-N6)-dimethyltransferase
VFVGCRRGAGPEPAGSRLRRRADRKRVHGQLPESEPRAQLRALGLRPHKRLSQSFLQSTSIAEAIVAAATLSGEDDVLEIGPGLGVLTARLLPTARRVVAVEIDPQLAAALPRAETLSVVNADILTFEPASVFDTPYVVVANLPYHITSPVLRHLLASGPPSARRLIVMVQAEVAERVTAGPGTFSALAVSIQAQAAVEWVLKVPRSAFFPAPKVDSAVIRLTPKAIPLVAPEHMDAFMDVVHAGFKQPRKTLLNSLTDGLGGDRQQAARLLENAKIDPASRPQTLDLADWLRLYTARGEA